MLVLPHVDHIPISGSFKMVLCWSLWFKDWLMWAGSSTLGGKHRLGHSHSAVRAFRLGLHGTWRTPAHLPQAPLKYQNNQGIIWYNWGNSVSTRGKEGEKGRREEEEGRREKKKKKEKGKKEKENNKIEGEKEKKKKRIKGKQKKRKRRKKVKILIKKRRRKKGGKK